MKKVRMIRIGILILFAAASMSYGTVISDFEGSLDGWNPSDPSTLTESTVGVTSGAGSMLIEGPGDWQIHGLKNIKDQRELFGVPGTQLTMDVTVVADDITSEWINVELIINGQNNDDNGANNNIGWQQLGQIGAAIDGVPQTIVWELSDDLTTKLAGVDENIGWLELALISNLDAASPTKFYVDNITVVPEPLTLSLLGLGGLTCLRRKRSFWN